ncbi:hypothetical protein SAMN05421720_107168 [Rhodospira trueperi]|uniref:Uncharacterized protein n=1 Tax=Rhodospira trueperi TaxID=69960 RepID=A0A1G7DFI0_9PROT|nr:hypothetical protein SAMN05421720_107168 [Rhodospira trueperi]
MTSHIFARTKSRRFGGKKCEYDSRRAEETDNAHRTETDQTDFV